MVKVARLEETVDILPGRCCLLETVWLTQGMILPKFVIQG